LIGLSSKPWPIATVNFELAYRPKTIKLHVVSVTLPSHAQIAARAYELYVQRGRLDGYEVDDWLQAEYELMQLPVEKIAELDAPKDKDKKHRSLINAVRSALMF